MTSSKQFIDSLKERIQLNIERRHGEAMEAYYSKAMSVDDSDLETLKLKKQALMFTESILMDVLNETIGGN